MAGNDHNGPSRTGFGDDGPEQSTGESNHSSVENESSGEEGTDLEWKMFKEDLHAHLQDIEAAGQLASQERYPAYVNPGLEILGKHSIMLPLRSGDADIIRDASKQAPFGRGDETIVDTSVRKTWELDHTQFRMCNPAWDIFLTNALLHRAAENLGLGAVRAEPYELLLYEPGSFFKPHRDSEKTPGMVATLVVCLPCEHQGGDVHVSFAKRKHVFATWPSSKFDLNALAWYSDVTHEVKELTSGYRLVLTYNIIMDAPSTASPSHYIAQSDTLRSMLKRWRRKFDFADKICYTLDHKYSQTGMSLSILKGRDAAVFQVLESVAEDAGLQVLVGHMSYSKSEDEYGDNWMEEESEMHLRNIFAPNGGQLSSSWKNMTMQELLEEDQFDEQDPESREEGEYTGNASMPTMLRYENTVRCSLPLLPQLIVF